ncbi:uncharacterized protein LOC125778976 isoform X5 [Bactrocera dorsalis]|uniref:Uncharacterized protein LOC125778976 isoform X5 n=1 Tax=Bactrocera dorsalis TaxID=27457 RepID=A0ABM3K0H0_BACDO|nr:uncharacterized protein LOC125778976 isoform X5 [Bactrocera dorsalis]
MKINFALPSLMLLTFVVNYSCASVVICFVRNGLHVNRTFNSEDVKYSTARVSLELTEDDIFMDNNRPIARRQEKKMLVSDSECNEIISQSAKSSIEVCIVNDQCKTFDLENNAKVKTVRDKLLASLPEYYRDEKCAYIVFLNDKRQVIQIEDEKEVPHRDIVKNGRIEAYNKFIDNTTELDITWLLYNHRVKVNMLVSLSSLRYWITKPNACPNLKSKLNLPDKALFPNAIDDLAQNWLARDKRAQLDLVTSRNVVSTQLVAPYAHEESLSIKSYEYKTEKSKIPRLYYVNVNEKDKVAFTGSRTDEFQDNQLTLKISSRSPKDKILLPLKDVRSTNNRAVSWTNVVIATNNTAVTLLVTWNHHQPGYAYNCELFDFRANHERHYLFRHVSTDGVCVFKHIDENKIHYDLLFNKEELIENWQDLSKFRYELGVVMLPYRPGKLSCQRGKRDTQYIANTDIHHDQITMGGGGKGNNTGHKFAGVCQLNDKEYAIENKRSLYFNVFIFKSQEIAEKIIEDVSTF